MLTDKLRLEIEKVDILTDFDEVIIKENSPYNQIYAYLLYLHGKSRLDLVKRLAKEYRNHKKRDILAFYLLLSNCPVDVIDQTVNRYKQNEKWNSLVNRLNPRVIGIVSRNNSRLILRYLDLRANRFPIKTDLIAANNPEIKDNIYTGNVELVVDNSDLVDFVREKDYICGKDEKIILEDLGRYTTKIQEGLYICTKQKVFNINFSSFFNAKLKNS